MNAYTLNFFFKISVKGIILDTTFYIPEFYSNLNRSLITITVYNAVNSTNIFTYRSVYVCRDLSFISEYVVSVTYCHTCDLTLWVEVKNGRHTRTLQWIGKSHMSGNHEQGISLTKGPRFVLWEYLLNELF